MSWLTYTGDYYSSELDYAWTIAMANQKLILRRKKSFYEVLTPADQDLFTLSGVQLEFERDEQGNVTRLLVSTSRVIDVNFEKKTETSSQ